jgi:hypothetical protein
LNPQNLFLPLGERTQRKKERNKDGFLLLLQLEEEEEQ